MTRDFRVAVLISGRGSNLGSLIRNAAQFTISRVFSDNPSAGGLKLAEDAGIPSLAFSKADFENGTALKDAIMRAVEEEKADLVALAGFMRVVPEWFVNAHFGRVVNIHPALLPKFAGLHTHERALEAGETTHGCSVHFVDAGVDTGPIIAQGSCEVMPGDDADTLAARVLKIEHVIYPWVVNNIAAGNISIHSGKLEFADVCAREASELGFLLPHLKGGEA